MKRPPKRELVKLLKKMVMSDPEYAVDEKEFKSMAKRFLKRKRIFCTGCMRVVKKEMWYYKDGIAGCIKEVWKCPTCGTLSGSGEIE